VESGLAEKQSMLQTAPVDPIDAAMGQRLRILRKERGVTQQQLGDGIGMTFQQVQKYERGTNRIAVSTLFKIARVLQVSPIELIDGLDHGQVAPEESDCSSEVLLRAYAGIASPEVRRSVLAMLQSLAREMPG